MKLEKLSDADENLELWRGSKIRLINNGIDMHSDDQYFDYILATAPWDSESMFLINITEGSHKAGAAYACKIPVDKSRQKIVATKDSLKKCLGRNFDHCYLITEI
jgi:hypothetical protein